MSTVSRWIKISGTGSAGPAGPPGPGGGVTPGTLGSVVVSEVGPRVLQPDQSTHTTLRVAMSIAGGTNQQNVTLYMTRNNGDPDGTTYAWQGYWVFYEDSTAYLEFDFDIPAASDIGFVSSNNIRILAALGEVPGGPTEMAYSAVIAGLPAGVTYLLSSAVTVIINPCVSSGLSVTLVNANDVTATPSNIYMGIDSSGIPHWQAGVHLHLLGAPDPNCWFYQVTIDWTNASGVEGNPGGAGGYTLVPGEQIFANAVNDGSDHLILGPINMSFPSFWSLFTYARFKVYGINRNNSLAAAFAATDGSATLMACWSGGTSQSLNVGYGSQILSVTAGDASALASTDPNYIARTADAAGSQFFDTYVEVALQSYAVPQFVAIFADEGDGQGWRWWENATISASGQVVTFRQYAPTSNATWQVAASMGWYPGDASVGLTLPSFAVESPTFAVEAIGLCSPTDLVGAEFIPDASGNLIQYATQAGGILRWDFYGVQFSQPGTDPAQPPYDINYWSWLFTVQKGYAASGVWHPAPDWEGANSDPNLQYLGRAIAAGTMVQDTAIGQIGPGQGFGSRLSSGSMRRPDTLFGPSLVQVFGDVPADWSYPDNSSQYRTYRFRLYAVSRLGTTLQGGGGTPTLQTTWPGGADHYDLTPTNHPATLDLSLTNPVTIAPPLGLDAFGKPTVKLAGPMFVNVSNALDMGLTSDFVVSGGQLTQNAVNLALAYHFGTNPGGTPMFTTAGGLFAINAIAVNYLLAGSAFFTGTAQFAYSGTGSVHPDVRIGSIGLVMRDDYISPNCTLTMDPTGLTVSKNSSLPGSPNNVQITAAGIGLYNPQYKLATTITSAGIVSTGQDSGGNQFSITLSPSAGITLAYRPYGSPATASLAMNATNIALVNGAFSIQISTTGTPSIQLSNGSGFNLTITASAIQISNGAGSTLTVSATGIAIVQGSLSLVSGTVSITIDATNFIKVANSAGGLAVALNGSGLTLEHGVVRMSLSSGGLFMIAGAVGTAAVTVDWTGVKLVNGAVYYYNGNPGFTGTLAAAIAAGKSVGGGIIY